MRSASVRAVARGTPRKSFHLSLLYTLPTQVTGHSWFEGLDWEALEKVESAVSVSCVALQTDLCARRQGELPAPAFSRAHGEDLADDSEEEDIAEEDQGAFAGF